MILGLTMPATDKQTKADMTLSHSLSILLGLTMPATDKQTNAEMTLTRLQYAASMADNASHRQTKAAMTPTQPRYASRADNASHRQTNTAMEN